MHKLHFGYLTVLIVALIKAKLYLGMKEDNLEVLYKNVRV